MKRGLISAVAAAEQIGVTLLVTAQAALLVWCLLRLAIDAVSG